MNMKHTPGPWTVLRCNRDAKVKYQPVYVLMGARRLCIGTTPNEDADAELIASAPELLKKAKSLIHAIDGDLDNIAKHWSATAELRAAIAKVTS